jgi:hypothetical protein
MAFFNLDPAHNVGLLELALWVLFHRISGRPAYLAVNLQVL